jgi:hypothetical protein
MDIVVEKRGEEHGDLFKFQPMVDHASVRCGCKSPSSRPFRPSSHAEQKQNLKHKQVSGLVRTDAGKHDEHVS